MADRTFVENRVELRVWSRFSDFEKKESDN